MLSGTNEHIASNLRILIVEDDDRIVRFLKRGLEAEGHEVDIATDTSQSLATFQTKAYDAVLLDIFLGDDNGLELCHTWKSQGFSTPILVMTAKDSIETKRESYQAGAQAYLQKPFSFDLLISTLQEMTKPDSETQPLSQRHERESGVTH